ncbi:MAG: N-acetyl-gamma-glutamyl-phosphate reductase [Spirochaetales bacterium]|nr:N-acetyl-gamma-glutamyl-phosphate reductase [Spirochaetales bacterium]
MKAAILGTTGYTGMLLLRLLAGHPEITSILPVSSSKPGEPLVDSDPGLGKALKAKISDGKYVSLDTAVAAKPDVVFAALPHLASADICKPFFGNTVVIDLSADFRIKDPALFEAAYDVAPPRPDLLEQAVFGLCEVYRKEVKTADLIANPGCYPTATLLPLLPVLKEFKPEGKIVVNAMSGISGAGRKANMNLIFSQRTENCGAYNPGRIHRHTLEIEKEAKLVSPASKLLFTPHLVPLKRGMAVTTAFDTRDEVSKAHIEELLIDAYKDEPFICLNSKRLPETADVRGSNRCDIGWHTEGNTIYLFSAIDNLVKGASGQAVQNMNIRFGFDETAGLSLAGQV